MPQNFNEISSLSEYARYKQNQDENNKWFEYYSYFSERGYFLPPLISYNLYFLNKHNIPGEKHQTNNDYLYKELEKKIKELLDRRKELNKNEICFQMINSICIQISLEIMSDNSINVSDLRDYKKDGKFNALKLVKNELNQLNNGYTDAIFEKSYHKAKNTKFRLFDNCDKYDPDNFLTMCKSDFGSNLPSQIIGQTSYNNNKSTSVGQFGEFYKTDTDILPSNFEKLCSTELAYLYKASENKIYKSYFLYKASRGELWQRKFKSLSSTGSKPEVIVTINIYDDLSLHALLIKNSPALISYYRLTLLYLIALLSSSSVQLNVQPTVILSHCIKPKIEEKAKALLKPDFFSSINQSFLDYENDTTTKQQAALLSNCLEKLTNVFPSFFLEGYPIKNKTTIKTDKDNSFGLWTNIALGESPNHAIKNEYEYFAQKEIGIKLILENDKKLVANFASCDSAMESIYLVAEKKLENSEAKPEMLAKKLANIIIGTQFTE